VKFNLPFKSLRQEKGKEGRGVKKRKVNIDTPLASTILREFLNQLSRRGSLDFQLSSDPFVKASLLRTFGDIFREGGYTLPLPFTLTLPSSDSSMGM